MAYKPLLISLPVEDRVRAHAFYSEALGLKATGEPADDGVPEPLLFSLNDATALMLVPRKGFDRVIGDRDVATPGTSECVLGIAASSESHVGEFVERVRGAGATVASEPAPQPWGYAAVFADPDGHLWTVTSAKLPKEGGKG